MSNSPQIPKTDLPDHQTLTTQNASTALQQGMPHAVKAPLLLMIDDEPLPADSYIRMLQRNGFHVEQRMGPDSAMEFLEKEHKSIRIILLDMMIPPRVNERSETQEGLATGFALLNEIRVLYPAIPILIVTNTVDPDILSQIESSPTLQLIQKIENLPRDVVEKVKEMLQLATQQNESRGERI